MLNTKRGVGVRPACAPVSSVPTRPGLVPSPTWSGRDIRQVSMNVYHCEQLMKTQRIPLISGSVQWDHLCIACGHREREIHSSTGKTLRWMNLTLRKRLAQTEARA